MKNLKVIATGTKNLLNLCPAVKREDDGNRCSFDPQRCHEEDGPDCPGWPKQLLCFSPTHPPEKPS